jgi:hypothetical protein
MRLHRHKPVPSAHQKQIRFMIGLVTVVAIVGTLLFIWLISHLADSIR